MTYFKTAMLAIALIIGSSGVPAMAQDAGPDEYAAWLKEPGNRERVKMFEDELEARGLKSIVPTYQILRSALSWRKCKARPFALPDQRYWPDAFRSLEVLKEEIIPRIGDVAIVSGYRSAALNSCAGGAKGSVHRRFGAFDVFATGSLTRPQMIEQLCDWHGMRGPELKAGLGIYRLKKFHIDVGMRGYRTWGSNYRRTSSPCVN